ncbi:hypothetical protein JNW90_14495 [Micromonospora sp. STR1s_5]|nr:hypothetical protein [Micromonospora sp. STR1s_5]
MLDQIAPRVARNRRAPAGPAPERVGLKELGQFIRGSALATAVAAVFGLVLGLCYVSITPRSYVATAKLLIEPQKAPQLVLQNSGFLDLTINNSQVESQVEVLRSDRISMAVVSRLGLIDDPEFKPRSFWGRPPPDEVLPADRQLQTAVAIFNQRVDIRRINQSYMIQISFRSESPDKAARLANAISDAYLQDQLDVKVEAARLSRQWLEQKIVDLREQMRVSAHAVQAARTGTSPSANPLDAEVTLTERESALGTYRKMYEVFLQKLAETAQQETYPSAEARVIGAATSPLSATYPNTKLILALSLVLGGMMGLGYSAARNAVDGRLKDAEALTRDLGLPVLGTLPKDHDSDFKNAVRRARTFIEASSVGGSLQLLGITSPGQGDGKTTFARELARSSAAAGLRTLLVDGNHANPTVSKMLLARLTPDDGRVPERTIIRSARLQGTECSPFLDILPLAAKASSPAGAFGSHDAGAKGRPEELRSSYDRVIFDLPAITDPDALAIVGQLDAVVLMADCGRTSLDSVSRAVDALAAVDAELLGVIANRCRPVG